MDRMSKARGFAAISLGLALAFPSAVLAGQALDQLDSASSGSLDQAFDNDARNAAAPAPFPAVDAQGIAGAKRVAPLTAPIDAEPPSPGVGSPKPAADKPSDLKLGLFGFLGAAIGGALGAALGWAAFGFIGLAAAGFLAGLLIADGTLHLSPQSDPYNLPGKTPGQTHE